MEGLGKCLLGLGAVLALLGAGLWMAARLGFSRIPGDIVVRRASFTVYAPLGLMLAVSILLTIALNLFFARR